MHCNEDADFYIQAKPVDMAGGTLCPNEESEESDDDTEAKGQQQAAEIYF